MEPITLLLIEDDPTALELLSHFLSESGFQVVAVSTASEGVAYIKNNHYDIVLLDLNLPDFSGLELLKNITSHHALPIIITSAFGDTRSKIQAFKFGASDYMVKPIDLEELEARIWVQLSKNSHIKNSEEKHLFEIREGHIFFKQQLLELTSIEFEILAMLIKHKNHTLSREQLLNTLSSLSSPRSLDNHIKNIRKKIGDNGNKAIYLKTEYGVGYQLRDYTAVRYLP